MISFEVDRYTTGIAFVVDERWHVGHDSPTLYLKLLERHVPAVRSAAERATDGERNRFVVGTACLKVLLEIHLESSIALTASVDHVAVGVATFTCHCFPPFV